MNTPSSVEFRISENELKQRSKRIVYGLLFSIALAAVVSHQHLYYPEDYNDVLFWSVIGFVLLANIVNYFRHLRYLARAKQHVITINENTIRFETYNDSSELELGDVAAMQVFRRQKGIGHIQLKLKNGRGIRLEGYNNMDLLLEKLKSLLPGKLIGN